MVWKQCEKATSFFSVSIGLSTGMSRDKLSSEKLADQYKKVAALLMKNYGNFVLIDRHPISFKANLLQLGILGGTFFGVEKSMLF